MNEWMFNTTSSRHPLHGTRGGHDPPQFISSDAAELVLDSPPPPPPPPPAPPPGPPRLPPPRCELAAVSGRRRGGVPGVVPTDLPTIPCTIPEWGLDLGARRRCTRRPGPADSPSDDAGLAPDSRRSQLCDGVPGARPRETARLRWNDPTVGVSSRSRPRQAPLYSWDIPSSNIGTAPSSMDPRECCDDDGVRVGLGGKTSSSHGAAHGVGEPTPLFVTASRTAGSNSRV